MFIVVGNQSNQIVLSANLEKYVVAVNVAYSVMESSERETEIAKDKR